MTVTFSFTNHLQYLQLLNVVEITHSISVGKFNVDIRHS